MGSRVGSRCLHMEMETSNFELGFGVGSDFGLDLRVNLDLAKVRVKDLTVLSHTVLNHTVLNHTALNHTALNHTVLNHCVPRRRALIIS